MKKHSLILFLLLSTLLSCRAGNDQYGIKVVREYEHDVTSYTQGLFFSEDGVMYESTGQYGESTMRVVDLNSGKALRKLSFDSKYFVEGSVIFEDQLYILTWGNKVVFVYDPETLEYKKTYSYPREGWGLTTDGESLIASDGSSRLYFLDGELRLKRSITVKYGGKPMRMLNELEYVDGRIWANVYLTDLILIINPKSGEVEGTIDCSGLLPKSLKTPDTDVLNGIAVHDGHIYLTGKYWPRLYEVELVKKKQH